MTSSTLLSVENLSIAFGAHQAVRDLSFTVAAGETVALVGESGSGKSASALAILRLIEREGGQITGGRIALHGHDPVVLTEIDQRALRAIRGNRISMVFQEPMTALNPVMSIGEQLKEVLYLHQRLTGSRARQAALAALDQVRIPDPERRLGQFPHELSGGLRQRVMIAMALACRPELLIADEPTTALDVTTQAEILQLIRDLQTEIGMAVLFITHDMGVVASVAERAVVLRGGEKIEEAAVTDLFARPQAAYTRALMQAAPRLGAGAPPAPRDPAPVLQVENLSLSFPVHRSLLPGRDLDFHAVSDVSLAVGRGETLGLVGESGCGKSSLARAIMRLVEPDRGRIRLEGQELTGLDSGALRRSRSRMQMVFQDPFASLNPRLPVRDLITEPAHIRRAMSRAERAELAADLLEKVGLERSALGRYAHQFSGGQRQRLSIARALSAGPALVIADEAVSALDVSIARQVTDLMKRLQDEEGLSFLFISHDIAVVERVSHRIAVMWAGRIVETGPTQSVLTSPVHPYTRRLLSSVPLPEPGHALRTLPPPRQTPPQLFAPGLLPPAGKLVEIAKDHFAEVEVTEETATRGNRTVEQVRAVLA
ncbi:ABC transporter ATP-binding protein [Palleronia sp.]|uniref:ABC transporter ATP-binding protein n=1 Tax=Palleronia sp. TaxID=1940284 RepID=UPI0035C80E48